MKKLLFIGVVFVLSGCVTTGTTTGSTQIVCDPNDKNVSMLKKMRCDLGGGYAASVSERERALVAARDENQQFAEIYRQISEQQKDTRASLQEQQRHNQRLNQSLQQLLGQVKAQHGHKAEVEQQIAQLESQTQAAQQVSTGDDPAAMARKQEELRALQQQLQRLQLSLGYE